MENNLTVTKEKSEALELHNRILINANMACASWVEACKCLKQMRDTKLYIELGFEEFEEYTTQALGIKERQAYTYISAYENLGERFLQLNAAVGITKLSLLAAVPVTERDDLVESNDLKGMTVKEVEELVKANNQKGEQIGLLTEELDSIKAKAANDKQRISELEEELNGIKKKPIEVAVREPSDEEIEKIRQQILKQAEIDKAAALKEQKKQLTEKYKKDNDSAVSSATEKANAEIAKHKKMISELEAAKSAADLKAKEFEKKLAVSTSPESVKFTFYFEALQGDYNKLIDSLKKIKSENPETAEKYIAAMIKFKAIVDNRIKEI